MAVGSCELILVVVVVLVKFPSVDEATRDLKQFVYVVLELATITFPPVTGAVPFIVQAAVAIRADAVSPFITACTEAIANPQVVFVIVHTP